MGLKKYNWILAFAIFAALAAVFQFSSPNIADPDGFYHLKHAQIYKDYGVLTKDFPWVQYSSISVIKSDLWYGFHILLIPFSGLNSATGIKIAGIFLATISLALLWYAFKRTGFKWPFLWTFFVFVSSQNIMTRFLMLRPHLLTMAISALIFSFSLNPAPSNKISDYTKRTSSTSVHQRSKLLDIIGRCGINGGTLAILILFAILAWTHISLSWVGILVFGTVFLLKVGIGKEWMWKKAGAMILGLIIGWLLRPNPIGALKLAYIQVVKLMQAKQEDAALLFGTELFPLKMETLFSNFLGFTIVWFFGMISMFFLYKSIRKEEASKKIFAVSSVVLSFIFFAMTMLTARRAHDFWVIFGIMLSAFVFTELSKAYKSESAKTAYGIVLGIALVFVSIYTPYKTLSTLKERGTPPEAFKKSSEWIKENSNPGDVVFNMHWSDFPMLFFWNDKNYYIGGMDPIFQYAFSEPLYWKFHYISADEVTKKTCPAAACTAEMLVDTHNVLKNDFKAKYIIIEKERNPLFNLYLEGDKENYEKKFDAFTDAVYLVK